MSTPFIFAEIATLGRHSTACKELSIIAWFVVIPGTGMALVCADFLIYLIDKDTMMELLVICTRENLVTSPRHHISLSRSIKKTVRGEFYEICSTKKTNGH